MNESHDSDMLVDIVDWRGIPVEAPMPLADAQARRLGYRSFHVWVLRETDDGRIEVLLRRATTGEKPDEGSFDVAVSGVVPAGDGWVSSALRQLESDLGIVATTGELRFAGKRSPDADLRFREDRDGPSNQCAVYLILFGRCDHELRKPLPDCPGMSWIGLEDLVTKRGVKRLLCHRVKRYEVTWVQEHPCVKSPNHKPPVARFSVTAGPAALFKRVRLVVRPETDYFDRAVHVRHLHPWNNIPTVDTVDAFMEDDISSWNLVGAEVRTDTGRFIRSHWNVRYRGDWCRLVLDRHGDVHALRKIADPLAPPFDDAITGGPVWDYVTRVNQALMDAALGFEERCDAIANGKIIVP